MENKSYRNINQTNNNNKLKRIMKKKKKSESIINLFVVAFIA